MLLRFFSSSVLLLCSVFALAAPENFDQAKKLAQRIHAPQARSFYCNCAIRWQGHKGIPDLAGCGYQVRKNGPRANRIEWEHVMPAQHFGHQRPCWQNGGRKNCGKSDAAFRAMEADLYNLVPAIGEVNGDRSNFRFSILSTTPQQHGACPVKVDFRQQVFEPPSVVRGDIARIYFYMADKYNLSLSRAQQQLMLAWHKQDPVSVQERELNQRIQPHMGHDNPFVSGKREWQLGFRPSGYGLIVSH
jgi:deoxyribonuclease I